MEQEDPQDDEDRAVGYIVERANRLKARVIVPCMIVGLAMAFAGAWRFGMEGGGRLRMLVAFFVPFLASVFLASLVLRIVLPRRAARWIIEASERFGVEHESLIGLVRSTALSVPSFDPWAWGKAPFGPSRR